MVLPPSLQSSLPAGWLAFTGRELNPLDRYKRFQITSLLPLFWIYPGAREVSLLNLPSHHSITLSARSTSEGGTSKPMPFAACRLIANSNVVGCLTGTSLAFSPLKTLGHLEKFFWPSRYESDSLTAMGHGRMERASH